MSEEENVQSLETAEIADIMEMIPHRYPFLLIDRVTEMVPGKSAVGLKNVTINENFFQGHFPIRPVMPGVLIIEAMAQTSGVLVVNTLGEAGKGKLVYFMTVDNCKFRKPVVPGDQVRLFVDVIRSRGPVWKFKGAAKVDDQLVCEAEFSAMIMDPGDGEGA